MSDHPLTHQEVLAPSSAERTPALRELLACFIHSEDEGSCPCPSLGFADYLRSIAEP